MKTGFKKKTMIAALTLACVCSLTGGAMLAANAEEVESATTVQTLSGFECKGASVRADQIGMRFEFNLSGDATNKKDATSGVVYMPYDLYTGDTANFTKDTAKAATAEFTWKDNAATEDTTDLVGYTYMDAGVIPRTMYNRVLLVRGYIEDDENVYYTDSVKTSMAYSAWKGIDALGETYKTQLQQYMGPYKLTYGDGENDKVDGLYYGDQLTLPETIDDFTVENWYWDAARTQKIESTDYATGSMNIYYTLSDVTVSGTISCADDIDLTKVKISVDGEETDTTVTSDGQYSLTCQAGKHTLKFYCDGYVGFATDFTAKDGATKDIALTANTFEVGDYKSVKSTTSGYDATDVDGALDVTGSSYQVLFPNTATESAFTYKVKATRTSPVDNDKHDVGNTQFGIVVSNGTKTLAFTLQYGGHRLGVVLNDGTKDTVHYYRTQNESGSTLMPFYCNGNEVQLVRSADKMLVQTYYNKEWRVLYTVTKDGITLDTTLMKDLQADAEHAWADGAFADFFGDEVELAVGLFTNGAYNAETVANISSTTTYECTFTKNDD